MRCFLFKPKSDTFQKFLSKIWHVVEILVKNQIRKKFHFKIRRVVKIIPQNLTGCILFNSESDALCFPSVQNLTCCEGFNSKSEQTKNVDFKIWCEMRFCFKNLMHCFPWNKKSDTLVFFIFKPRRVIIFFKSKSVAM